MQPDSLFSSYRYSNGYTGNQDSYAPSNLIINVLLYGYYCVPGIS